MWVGYVCVWGRGAWGGVSLVSTSKPNFRWSFIVSTLVKVMCKSMELHTTHTPSPPPPQHTHTQPRESITNNITGDMTEIRTTFEDLGVVVSIISTFALVVC